MDNKKIALELLKSNPDLTQDFEEESTTESNDLPPIEVAHPELQQLLTQGPKETNEEDVNALVKDLEDYHKESALSRKTRQGLSVGARALEGLGGSLSFFLNALTPELHENEMGMPYGPGEKPKGFPSQQELREFTKEKTGKKLEPKSQNEKDLQEAASDVGSALPFGGGWAQRLLLPVLGQGAKMVAKGLGATESQADAAKLTFLLGSTIARIGNAPQFARNAYREAIEAIPQGLRMRSNVLQQGLNRLRNQPWFRTGRTTAKGPAMDEIERLENLIQHGSLDVHDFLQARRDLGEARKKLGAFNYEPGIDKAQARQYLDRIDEVINEAIEDFGRGYDPQWLNNYRRANQAYAVTQRSRNISDAISNSKYGRLMQSDIGKTLFHVGGAGMLAKLPSVGLAAVPVAATAKGIQLMNRVWRSPLLRNYYAQVIAAATAQNMGALNKALEKFDNEAKKVEKSQNSPKAKSHK